MPEKSSTHKAKVFWTNWLNWSKADMGFIQVTLREKKQDKTGTR